MNFPAHEKILVLDFGSQYAQLIARRVRECGVYAEIVAHDISVGELGDAGPKGLILSGGPASVLAENAPMPDPDIFSSGLPVLGICYGMQLMGKLLGGEVVPGTEREYGGASLQVLNPGVLFAGGPEKLDVWMSHGDRLLAEPSGFRVLAKTESVPIASIADEQRRLYAVQFHPEVVHTPRGVDILRNFLFKVCGCSGDWEMSSFVEETSREIRERVAGAGVICGVSGGVDSTVTATLLTRALGKENVHCIFVDNGVLREGEAEAVPRMLRERIGLDVIAADAVDDFLDVLAGIADPEKKRKAIGRAFIDVFTAVAEKVGGVKFLAQGTLYPDVIESSSPRGGPSATIKSHHNVGGLPETLGFDLIEPLRYLFKDEVRRLGAELGIPDELLKRQPFPGPGLAVRIVGEVTRERLATMRKAGAIIEDEIEHARLPFELWQYFPVLLPVRSVGVMGDERTYENVLVLRAVVSDDGMTADWAKLPHDLLARVSRRVVNEVKGVNRVMYDITSKPPGTIEWE